MGVSEIAETMHHSTFNATSLVLQGKAAIAVYAIFLVGGLMVVVFSPLLGPLGLFWTLGIAVKVLFWSSVGIDSLGNNHFDLTSFSGQRPIVLSLHIFALLAWSGMLVSMLMLILQRK